LFYQKPKAIQHTRFKLFSIRLYAAFIQQHVLLIISKKAQPAARRALFELLTDLI